MIDMHSKYDNMHKNGIFYVFVCINNHVIISLSCMLSGEWLGGGFVVFVVYVD